MAFALQAWMDLLWRGALAATIPAIVIVAAGRFLAIRPPTRHTLWLIVLAWFVVAPLLPAAPIGKIASVFMVEKGPRGQGVKGSSDETVASNEKITTSSGRGVERPGPLVTTRAPLPVPSGLTARDSIHARTGPSVPNRLARAPRLVGHGLDVGRSARDEKKAAAAKPKLTVSPPKETDKAKKAEERPAFAVNVHHDKTMSPSRTATSELNVQRPAAPAQPSLRRPTGYLMMDEATRRAARTAQSPFEPMPAGSILQPATEPPEEPHPGPPLSKGREVSQLRAAVPHASAIAVWIDACRNAAASVKGAIARIPPIPAPAWAIGIALIVFARGLAYLRFARCLHAARRAPSGIQRMVRRSARVIGLSPAPQVLMIAGRVSPMVSFIGKRRLILPTELWSQLDEPGRQAIVFHELAHLRRRDDWVRWFENAVSCLYWWHPVVWWLCRRLREEAETCCDAWVTWLMPSGRRAYAEALLATSRYVGSSSTALPAVGIGATSVRARRFARRLTMVMTNPSRPRMSLSGAALTTALAVATWLATPAWSYPPSPDKPDCTATPKIPMTTCTEATPAIPPVAPTPPVAAAPTVATTTPRPMTALTPPTLFNAIGTTVAKGLLSATEYPPERRKRSNDGDLEARLDRLERRLEELTERLSNQPPTPRFPRAIAIPGGEGQPGVMAIAPRARRAPGGPKEWRHYNLPEGKLDALISLMSRDDVPVLVRQQGDGIDVEATPDQHEIFEAFVRMINPADGEGNGGTRVRLRTTRRRTPAPSAGGSGTGQSGPAARQRADEVRAQADAKEADMDALEAQKDQMESLAETLRERAEALKESAENFKDETKARTLKEVAEILKQAQSVAGEMKNADRMLKKTADELRGLEGEADRLDDQADAEDDEDENDEADAEDDDHADHEAPIAKALTEALKAHAKAEKTPVKNMIKAKDDERAKALHKADEFFTRHQWSEAAAEYEAFIETHPDDGRAWYNLGYSYHMGRKFDQAFKAFQRSVELGTRKGDSLYNIACGYSLKNDKDKAIEWLSKAVEAGYRDANNMQGDSDLDHIRDDARYKEIVDGL